MWLLFSRRMGYGLVGGWVVAFADVLNRLIAERGWRSADLASRFPVAARTAGLVPCRPPPVTTISRWRTGARRPGAYYAQVLAAVFEVSLADLRLVDSLEEAHVKRREFNRLAGLALAAGLTPGSLDLERLAAALSGRVRSDGQTFEQLSQLTTMLFEQIYTVSPDLLLPALRGHLDTCLALIRDSPADNQLTSVAGETAQMVGWMYYRLGRRSDAHVHYALATSLGDQARNGALQARTLIAMSKLHSHQVVGERKPSPAAIACLDRAATLAGSGWLLAFSTSSNLPRWLATCQAEEHAAAGDSPNAYSALDRAEAVVGALHGPAVGREEAWLDGYRGTCLLLLGRPRDAVAVLQRALASTEPELVADRCVVIADLASGHARLGEVERACELLTDGLAMATSARLAPRVQRILSVRRHDLTAHEDSPAVRQLDERLAMVPSEPYQSVHSAS
jgi:tetratricopeptide (TPR) repeat protein